jgi:hypothetical protein
MNSVDLLRKAADALELAPSADTWDALVSHLGRALNVDWVFVTRLLPDTETKLRTLAAWHKGKPIQDFEYQLSVSLDDLLPQGISVHVRDAWRHVQNAWLKRVKAEVFGQIKLKGSVGQTRGMLAVAHPEALQSAQQIESMLRIFAFKATVELERELLDERFYCELLETIRGPGLRT